MFDNAHFSRFLYYIPPSPASSSTPSLPSIFPELSSLFHNRQLLVSPEGLSGGANNMDIEAVIDHQIGDSGASDMLDAFDYGDEDDPASDLQVHVSIYEINESHLVINSLASQSSGMLDGENTHLQNDLFAPSTRSSSPALSYVDEDDPVHPDAVTQLSSQIFLGNTATETLTQDFLDGSQFEISLSRSLDQTERMVATWQILEAPEPPCPTPSEPVASDTYSDVNEGQ